MIKVFWARASLALRLNLRRQKAHASGRLENALRLSLGEVPAHAPLA